MTQVKLTAINRYSKTSAAGKPYTSVSITTEEHGARKISGFGNKDNASWQEGDTVEIDIEQKGEYLNFKVPKGTYQKGGTTPDLNRLEAKLDIAINSLNTLGGQITAIKGVLGDILSKVDLVDSARF